MSTLTQFTGGGSGSAVPKKVTTYTSGTGTFTPQAGTTWMKVTLVGGGGAGFTGDVSGPIIMQVQTGKNGQCSSWWLENTQSTYTYIVGAGGISRSQSIQNIGTNNGSISYTQEGRFIPTNGGNTTFGSLISRGGTAGAINTIGAVSGAIYPFYFWDIPDNGEYGIGNGNNDSSRGYGIGGGMYADGTGGLIIVEEY